MKNKKIYTLIININLAYLLFFNFFIGINYLLSLTIGNPIFEHFWVDYSLLLSITGISLVTCFLADKLRKE